MSTRASLAPVARPTPRILVAGMGNVLRGDDAFGVILARRLAATELPEGVHVVESGIAGISLVQELIAGYDALLILDAVARGRPPGTLALLSPQVGDGAGLTDWQRHELFADMHQADPSRTLVLARALDRLPRHVLILGCEPQECDDVMGELTPAVAAAMTSALELATSTINDWVRSGDLARAVVSS
ncbi:MAG: hydrogenase maturation protease [Candidatus Dormibacteria bacterium]